MPNVLRHTAVEDWLYDACRAYLTKTPRTGIHVSDLLLLRKAYWQRVEPKPPSRREILYFMAGRGHEEVVVALSGLGAHRKARGEWLGPIDEPYPEGDGIRYEMDVLYEGEDHPAIPFEIKTNRRAKVIDAKTVLDDYALAVDQLGMYCAIKNLPVGYLFELHLMARNLAAVPADATEAEPERPADEPDPYAWLKQSRPEMPIYQITWTTEEREAILALMPIRRGMLESALAVGDHTGLPECPEWMCGKVHIRRSAPVCPMCGTMYTVGEVKPDGKKRGVRQYCETCKVGGRLVGGRQVGGTKVELVRDSQEIFVPGCRWWASCLPAQHAKYHQNFWKPKRTGSADEIEEAPDDITPDDGEEVGG
jgi:hypothetical protein